jgi:hypothetical protein
VSRNGAQNRGQMTVRRSWKAIRQAEIWGLTWYFKWS